MKKVFVVSLPIVVIGVALGDHETREAVVASISRTAEWSELLLFLALACAVSWPFAVIGIIIKKNNPGSPLVNVFYALFGPGPILSAVFFTWRSNLPISSLFLGEGPWPSFDVILSVGLAVVSFSFLGLLVNLVLGRIPISILKNSNPVQFLGFVLVSLVMLQMEEIGWRAFALPRALELLPPFAASLFVGSIWAFWHIPLFFFSGPLMSRESGMSSVFYKYWYWTGVYWWLSIFMTEVYRRSEGSRLLSVLIHSVFNSSFLLLGLPVMDSNDIMESEMKALFVIGAFMSIVSKLYYF